MADEPLAEQRRITKLALDMLASDGFALAGSGAIREHGFINRPTQDVDLFTVQTAHEQFSSALDRMIHRFEQAGYHVEAVRRQAGFAQLSAASPTGAVAQEDAADPMAELGDQRRLVRLAGRRRPHCSASRLNHVLGVPSPSLRPGSGQAAALLSG